jgi:capsular polysaccharide transport system permease protein
MVAEIKDKTKDRLVSHISAARHALRVPRLGIASERLGVQPHEIRPNYVKLNEETETATEGSPWLVVSFTAVVALPIVVASLYFGFLVSDQFVSELRFAVRGTTERLIGTDALGTVGGLAYLNSSQEVYAIADYIRSRAVVDEVSKTIDLRRAFRAGGADWLSRLKDRASSEELLRYWRRMITVSTEAVSGLVSVEVRAFTPEDAVAIASAIRSASEALVNRLQQRPREDMVSRAEDEVRVARHQAGKARDQVARFRALQGTVDPLDTARSLIDNVTELKANLVALEIELASAKAATGSNAPNVRTLQARRDSVNDQIKKLERRITGTSVGERTSASLMAEYDKVEIGRTLAEQQVAVAEKLLDQLRIAAHRHQIYVEVIEGPTLPQSALFPERTLSVGEIALKALGLWGIVFLTFTGVRDHAG